LRKDLEPALAGLLIDDVDASLTVDSESRTDGGRAGAAA
jgi:hypothetical protein